MVNFIQKRRREISSKKAIKIQEKKQTSTLSENIFLLAIVVFAVHYIFQIQYLEILGTFIAIASAMTKGREIGKLEGFEEGFIEGFDKGCE